MPRVPSALHRLDGLLARRVRELTTAGVSVLLLAAASAGVLAEPPAAPSPLTATSSSAVTVLELPEPTPTAAPAPVVVPRPSATPTASPTPRPAAPVRRWLPSGTGMWLHDWARSERGHADVVVARARRAGLTHLYVQTGSSRKGWIGTPVLSQLLPATAGTDLKVIAWDFPKLVRPAADAHRLARAASFRRPGAPRVAAVAPDVETGAEGTHLSAAAIDRYYTTLRAALPPDVAIIATVPWPSEHRVNSYPYHRTMRYADAVSPMAYWYNRSPRVVTATSMSWLRRFGKPVLPVGQGYDGRIDAPYLKADPAPGRSVQAFLDAARAGGAPAVSLWSWQTTGAEQWQALVRAAGFPAVPPVAPPPVVVARTTSPSPRPLPTVAPVTSPLPELPVAPTPDVTPGPEPS